MRSRLLILAVIVLCGCSPNAVETLLVTSDCVFGGPDRVDAGEIRLSINQEGLGETGAAVIALRDDHSYEDVRAHFESTPGWEQRPGWMEVQAALSIGASETSASKSVFLTPGPHAVICIRHWENDAALPVAPLEVEPG